MKLFKSWITHNSDKNKEIVASGEMAIATYSALGDAYHTLMARINVADAKMGLGKLLEAEQELNEILIEAKKCGCKDLNTINPTLC